jgi:hypothetical protein
MCGTKTEATARQGPINSNRDTTQIRKVATAQTIDLRSFVAIMRVLNELLINPMVTVVAPPHFSKGEPASDRSPRENDSPKMPNFRPGGFRTQAQNLKIIMALHCHFRRGVLSVPRPGAPSRLSIPAKRSSSRTFLRSRRSSRNRLARSPGDAIGFGVRSFEPCRALEEAI